MIKASGIQKSYNDEKVLKGVSLEIKAGEFVSIMGESGSGKSTLLSILGGFLAPDAGQVTWWGEDVSTFSNNRLAQIRSTEVGFVFQFFRLIPTLTVQDNLYLPATLGKKMSQNTREYVAELVEELNLSGLLKKYPTQLSGGQCQRVAIIRALAYKPSLVILDEPTGALDSSMEEKVMALLSKVNRVHSTAIVQVTHSKKVADYGNRIIYLKDGEITNETVF
ncbi:MAG: ABC transporter ATP-binding protein [Clostridiales bacterium]|nr:ABC transporter ATP-binding protein [Clostridiales bacterium]